MRKDKMKEEAMNKMRTKDFRYGGFPPKHAVNISDIRKILYWAIDKSFKEGEKLSSEYTKEIVEEIENMELAEYQGNKISAYLKRKL